MTRLFGPGQVGKVAELYSKYNKVGVSSQVNNLLRCAVVKKNPNSYGLSKSERRTVSDYALSLAKESFLPKKYQSVVDEMERFCVCGQNYYIDKCQFDDIYFRTPLGCNSRLCEVCAGRYAKRLKSKMDQLFGRCASKQVRGFGLFMLTLTTTTKRHGGTPGRDDIKRFYDESGKFLKLFYGKYKCQLRQDKKTKAYRVVEDQKRIYYQGGQKCRYTPKIRTGKKGQTIEDYRKFRGGGYMSSLELGHGSKMLHCHAIVYGPYVSVKKMREIWLKLTGDSFIVDIRPVRNPTKAANYVLKYITKAPATAEYSELAEYFLAIKGSRRIRTGGIFYNELTLPKPKSRDKGCPFCGNFLERWGSEVIGDFVDSNAFPLYWLRDLAEKYGGDLPIPWKAAATKEAQALQVLIAERFQYMM